MSGDRSPVIVGVGLSDYPVAPHLTAYGHHAQAVKRALDDSGISKDEIDGYMSAGANGLMIDDVATMAEYLGIRHRVCDGTMVGGSAPEVFVDHATEMIRSGRADTVLISYGSDLRSNKTRALSQGMMPVQDGPRGFEQCYGTSIISGYAMMAQRHMHQFGTTSEQLAEIAVSARLHAANNPHALKRDPLTIEEVVSAPRIADPLGRHDCCVITDGGGAVIMTTAERARDLKQKPIYVLGSATSATHWNIMAMPDFTSTGAATCGPEAFARAGLTPDDIDTVQLYDSFTITAMLLLEGLGFCKHGEGGPFVADGRLRPGGALPVNTDGGGLASSHPGMRGIFALIEAVLQVRGQADGRQIPGAKFGLACGSGGAASYISTVILGSERP
jgi:acetyl-CoA acetyltransferase